MKRILKIEEYVAKRKQEDMLNEFDKTMRIDNIKTCVNYVFEYFNNYLNIEEFDEHTVLHNEKIEKYRKQLDEYDEDVVEWLVTIYHKHDLQLDKHVRKATIDDEYFFLYDSDKEYRKLSYDFYARKVKKLPFLKNETEMLFRLIKEYHRVMSLRHAEMGFPVTIDFVDEWIETTWTNNKINVALFASNWVYYFHNRTINWPMSERSRNSNDSVDIDYNYKKKSNLFNLNSLYTKMPVKTYTKKRKQEFEVLLMYYWLHDMQRDDEYWQEYIEKIRNSYKSL